MTMAKELEVLDTLPVAEKRVVAFKKNGNYTDIDEQKAIYSEDKLVSFVSDNYALVQHKDAFLNVIEGMSIPDNANVELNVAHTRGKAWMRIMLNELQVQDDATGITLGISIRNSFDRSTSLGLQVSRSVTEKGNFVVFYGMRQVCSNGMKIKVPLSQFSNAELDKMKPEDVTAERNIISVHNAGKFAGSIRHYGKKFAYNFEALTQMAKSAVPYIENRITEAIEKKMPVLEFENWLKTNGFGDRAMKKILQRFNEEEKNAWQAYNSITAYATHDVDSTRQKENLLDTAWTIVA